MEAIQNELVEAEAALEAIKQRRHDLAEQIGVKRRAANNNTNLQQELKGTKETLKVATQRVAAAKAAVAAQAERNAAAAAQRERNAAEAQAKRERNAAEAQRERNAQAKRERNAAAAAAEQRQRNVTARAERNAQAAKNAKSIGWFNRMGNKFARTFNPTPGIGLVSHVENKISQIVNPLPGIEPIDYIESAIAEKFNPVAEDIKKKVTSMVNDQKRRIDSTLSSITTQLTQTTNQQKKNILLALKSLLEKMSVLNKKLTEYLATYEFIPVWIIFTISNLSYLLTLVLMFYFFMGIGQSVILALIVMRIGHTLFGQKSTVVKQTLEATGVAPAARAMYNISVGAAHRSAAAVAEEERKEEEVPLEEEAEQVAQVIATYEREAPDLQARHRAWIGHALKGSAAAKGAAEAAQAAYQEAKAAGKTDDEADAAADAAGIEAAERISPKPVKQTEKDLEIGGLVGAIGGGIAALFEACGIGRIRRPPRNPEDNEIANSEWAKIQPLLQDPFMKQERIRVNEISDAELQEEIESFVEQNPDSINTRGVIIDGKLHNRMVAERKLLAFLSKQHRSPSASPLPRKRTRKAKRTARKSRKQRRN